MFKNNTNATAATASHGNGKAVMVNSNSNNAIVTQHDEEANYGDLVSLLCRKDEQPPALARSSSVELVTIDLSGKSLISDSDDEDDDDADDAACEVAPLLLRKVSDVFKRASVMSAASSLELPAPQDVEKSLKRLSWASIQGFDRNQSKLEQTIHDLEQQEGEVCGCCRRRSRTPADTQGGSAAKTRRLMPRFNLVSVVIVIVAIFACVAGVTYMKDGFAVTTTTTAATPTPPSSPSAAVGHDNADVGILLMARLPDANEAAATTPQDPVDAANKQPEAPPMTQMSNGKSHQPVDAPSNNGSSQNGNDETATSQQDGSSSAPHGKVDAKDETAASPADADAKRQQDRPEMRVPSILKNLMAANESP
eukprot:CAMPEP_0119573810 /NCGR_PEP_ID=MMETSP1352-20130426/45309_1 /TAXON_ID=265584 /ORGANISM="Stauroneis constricta, Strain CCMP1120" /LENGTH=365 /DNA_ID=CAMNT_0007623501 /DNA_START=1037 /DNA_END=2134 /DNA_ORIENTATION=+